MKKDYITYINTNGREVTTGKKYTKYPYDISDTLLLEEDNEMLTVTNPFSGQSYRLTPVEESVYSTIMGAQMIPGYQTNKELIQIVRDGLDWFRDNNAEAYMTLLD
tara:strand:+ start:784 stop:1101 length:318 start_codon:yes stop_codon:yes gene_type:complete